MPATGPARKTLQKKGQFWTPPWVAEAMVAYVLAPGWTQIFDPAVGAGAFLRAAKSLLETRGHHADLRGMELDPAALAEARRSGLTDADLRSVLVGDFVLSPPHATFSAIVANPPYLRHHRLPPETKACFKTFAQGLIGRALDGRAGLHVFFLLRALSLLEPGGRLAFIMPSDTCEGVFAETLWAWITGHFRLEAVVTFAPEATPFPGVDINAVIVLLRREPPCAEFVWARCLQATPHQLREWVQSGFADTNGAVETTRRTLAEGMRTGLTRRPQIEENSGLVLGDLASVQRGIATGANDFFFMTAAQAQAQGIPPEFLVRAVGRTRDVDGEEITAERLHLLDAQGRPTYLLNLGKADVNSLPVSLRDYLDLGETLGLPTKPQIARYRPWYNMEIRTPPPFLFAYLGRRNARFIRNTANVLPLTGFLCIYPRWTDAASLEQLWQILRHPSTVENLARVGKSYGSGAIKVEPRSLERLPLPESLVAESGLLPVQRAVQLPMRFYESIRSNDAKAAIAEELKTPR